MEAPQQIFQTDNLGRAADLRRTGRETSQSEHEEHADFENVLAENKGKLAPNRDAQGGEAPPGETDLRLRSFDTWGAGIAPSDDAAGDASQRRVPGAVRLATEDDAARVLEISSDTRGDIPKGDSNAHAGATPLVAPIAMALPPGGNHAQNMPAPRTDPLLNERLSRHATPSSEMVLSSRNRLDHGVPANIPFADSGAAAPVGADRSDMPPRTAVTPLSMVSLSAGVTGSRATPFLGTGAAAPEIDATRGEWSFNQNVLEPRETSPARTAAAGWEPLRADARTPVAQIAEAIRTARDGTVEISLHPEELGKVRISLTGGDGILSLQVHSERLETADLIRRHIALLQEELRQLGFTSVSIELGSSSHDGDKPPESDADISTLDIESHASATPPGGEPILQVHRLKLGGLDLRV